VTNRASSFEHRAADLLDKRDYDGVGKLMYDSHESLQHDFLVSCKELDLLVDIVRKVPGVFGSRFGGAFRWLLCARPAEHCIVCVWPG